VGADEQRLFDLVDAVLEGRPVDWTEAESSISESQRAILAHLRAVAGIASFHARPSGLQDFRSAASDLAPVSPPLATSSVSSSPPENTAPGESIPEGTTWGSLRLLERVGQGAFGDVYRARDPRLDREVALKLLKRVESRLDSVGSVVIDEGRLLARVRHPNVVTVYGADRIDGRVGLWMEFVRGRTLEAVLGDHGPFGAHEATLVGLDLCRALSAVHSAGLIHRDVKAQNVMREADGRIVLMDFGTGREDLSERPADLAGTPLYLAPEVFGGARATAQSDIYSVGVLLFHLVTSAYPVKGRTVADIRAAHVQRRRVWLRDARPDLPDTFVQTVERALKFNPDLRYESAGAMEVALARVVSSTDTAPSRAAAEPIAAAQSVEARRSRSPRRPEWLAGAALAFAVAITAIVMPAAWRDRVLGRNVWRPGQSGSAGTPPSSDSSLVGAVAVSSTSGPGLLPAPAEPSATAAAEALKFKGRDWVLIAQFENKTSQPVLDGTLEAALERELANSAFVNVAPRDRIDDVLQLMRKPIDSVVDTRLGCAIAQRDGGIRALLSGRVETIGPSYVFTVQILNPANGVVVGSLDEAAATPQELLGAVRQIAFRVREGLGEMLSTIRTSDTALEKVTTPSLHALQLYSQAAAFMHGDGNEWRNDAAEPLLRQAIAEDPTFASAHILLAWAMGNQGRPQAEFLVPARRAVELAGQTSDVERYFIEASYHDLASRSNAPSSTNFDVQRLRRAVALYEALMRIKPDHYWGVGNLAGAYSRLKQEPEASKWLVRKAEIRSTSVRANLDAAEHFRLLGNVSNALLYCRRARGLGLPANAPALRTEFERCEAIEDWMAYRVPRVLDRAVALERSALPKALSASVSMYVGLGRFDDAERVGPSSPYVMWWARVWLGDPRALAHRKQQVAGVPVERTFAITDPGLFPFLVSSYVREGDLERARQVAATATALTAAHKPVRTTNDDIPQFLPPDDLFQYEGAIAVLDGRLEDAARALRSAKEAGAWGVELLRLASLLAGGWQAKGDPQRAIKVLEAATVRSEFVAAVVDSRGGVAYWIALRNELAELYYAKNRLIEAKAVDGELLKLLAVADPHHPVLLKLRARGTD
jgi:serine/threonine-protein kinase